MPDFARLRAKRLFLLDLDGTLYLDERLFDGAADFLRAIRSRGGTYRFLTNNSSRGAESYVEKLRRLGVEAEISDFLTSVDALIAHLHAQGMAEKLLYVCGTQSMKRQLTQAGLRLTDDRDAAVDALVMGFDAVKDSVGKGKAQLVLCAGDLSEGTRRRVGAFCEDWVEVADLPETQFALAQISKKPTGVFAVTDPELAKLCRKNLAAQAANQKEERPCQ